MDGIISTESLSERERAYLEHVRQARELGVSLSEYCKTFALDVREWYAVKRELVRRGVLPGRVGRAGQEDGEDGEGGAGFIPVTVSTAVPSMPAVVCRIRHPLGWVLECMSLPSPSWLLQLLGEDGDVASTR
jgi:hypothetical protein